MGEPFGKAYWDYYVNSIPATVELLAEDGSKEQFHAQEAFTPPSQWDPKLLDALERADGPILDVETLAGKHASWFTPGFSVEAISDSSMCAMVCEERSIPATICPPTDLGIGRSEIGTVLSLGFSFPMDNRVKTVEALREFNRVTVPTGKAIVNFTPSSEPTITRYRASYDGEEKAVSRTTIPRESFQNMLSETEWNVSDVWTGEERYYVLITKT